MSPFKHKAKITFIALSLTAAGFSTYTPPSDVPPDAESPPSPSNLAVETGPTTFRTIKLAIKDMSSDMIKKSDTEVTKNKVELEGDIFATDYTTQHSGLSELLGSLITGNSKTTSAAQPYLAPTAVSLSDLLSPFSDDAVPLTSFLPPSDTFDPFSSRTASPSPLITLPALLPRQGNMDPPPKPGQAKTTITRTLAPAVNNFAINCYASPGITQSCQEDNGYYCDKWGSLKWSKYDQICHQFCSCVNMNPKPFPQCFLNFNGALDCNVVKGAGSGKVKVKGEQVVEVVEASPAPVTVTDTSLDMVNLSRRSFVVSASTTDTTSMTEPVFTLPTVPTTAITSCNSTSTTDRTSISLTPLTFSVPEDDPMITLPTEGPIKSTSIRLTSLTFTAPEDDPIITLPTQADTKIVSSSLVSLSFTPLLDDPIISLPIQTIIKLTSSSSTLPIVPRHQVTNPRPPPPVPPMRPTTTLITTKLIAPNSPAINDYALNCYGSRRLADLCQNNSGYYCDKWGNVKRRQAIAECDEICYCASMNPKPRPKTPLGGKVYGDLSCTNAKHDEVKKVKAGVSESLLKAEAGERDTTTAADVDAAMPETGQVSDSETAGAV
ncbi:hypothetical protein LTR64_000024 [Lithohypha guttulata]|uniref:uncharacterized protein n=1 Tax=Lithohypha guttulata TaxID=1690604 RepID=UPI002DE0B2AE|nr:hypothetical protein LTR51_007386 [Lithohypha guttulata]